jgi:hypothetical protein
MLNSPPPSTRVVQACVVVGSSDTRYRCAGRGEPVVLLMQDAAAGTALLAGLPRNLRGIAPDATPLLPSVDFDRWLGEFLDALGVTRTTLVSDAAFAAAAHDFATHDPERVTGLLVIERDARASEIAAFLDSVARARIDV